MNKFCPTLLRNFQGTERRNFHGFFYLTITTLLTGLLTSLLTGCGFTLRSINDFPAPLRHLTVISDNTDNRARIQLQQMVSEASDPKHNLHIKPYHLHLLHENTAIAAASTTLTYGSQYNTVTLTYTLNYRIETPDSHIVPNSDHTITTNASYTISNNQMLGNTKMQSFYEKQLVREALTLLVSQLAAVSPRDLAAASRDLHETHSH